MDTPASFAPDDGTPKSFIADPEPDAPPRNLAEAAALGHSIQPQDRRPAFLKVSDTLLPADVADRLTTVIARPAAEAATRPAPVAGPVPSLIDHAQSLAGTAGQVATTHAVQALGGSTMTEIWERAGHSAKDLVESLLGEPWEETRTRAPQPAKTAEFLYHASKIVPGIADFLFTPAGAATNNAAAPN